MIISESSKLGKPAGDRGRDGGVEYFLLYVGRVLCLLEEVDDLRRLPEGLSPAFVFLLGDVGADAGAYTIV